MNYERIEKNKIKIRAKPQARQDFDPAKLMELADSLLAGQLQPVGVLSDYTLIWGERRLGQLFSRRKSRISGRRFSTRRSPNQSSCSCGQQRIFSGRTSRTTKSS